jgi:hypothetical protein
MFIGWTASTTSQQNMTMVTKAFDSIGWATMNQHGQTSNTMIF